jgi:hypothetical protein
VWLGQRNDDPLKELDILMKLGRTSSIKRIRLKKSGPEGENNSIQGDTSKAPNLDELIDLL